jgi:hypothetical protein
MESSLQQQQQQQRHICQEGWWYQPSCMLLPGEAESAAPCHTRLKAACSSSSSGVHWAMRPPVPTRAAKAQACAEPQAQPQAQRHMLMSYGVTWTHLTGR